MAGPYLNHDEEDDLSHLMFVPAAYRARRGTTVRNTPSSPTRGVRHTPGYTASRTPPPPPLNRDGEPLHYGSPVMSRAAQPEGMMAVGGEFESLFFVGDVPEMSTREQQPNNVPGNWIMVAGVTREDHLSIVRYLRKYGNIETFFAPGGLTPVNYVFVKFETEASAARPLQSNLHTTEDGKCFGVALPTVDDLVLLERHPELSTPGAYGDTDLKQSYAFQINHAASSSAPESSQDNYSVEPAQVRGISSVGYFLDFLFGR